MITAKFNTAARSWLLGLAIAAPIAFVSAIGRIFFSRDLVLIVAGAVVCFIPIVFLVRLFNRATYVELSSGSILTKPLLGYGKAVSYRMEAIDGFSTSTLNGRTRLHKAIYIMSGNKKIAVISELYHANYDEMVQFCSKNMKHLGAVKSGIFT